MNHSSQSTAKPGESNKGAVKWQLENPEKLITVDSSAVYVNGHLVYLVIIAKRSKKSATVIMTPQWDVGQ
jgi:hypothetical protein